jgi:lipid-A-disaccharide synthase
VWAWRQKRVFKIARAVDLMLTLFPFEARFYKAHKIAVKFVGHPLADLIPLEIDKAAARRKLDVAQSAKIVALLPGSRGGEIAYIGKSFLDAARWLHQHDPEISFLLPYVNEARKAQLDELITAHAADLPITLINGRSREVMAACDVVVLASGTATLEAMLLKRPMVVAYKVSAITHYIMKRLLKAPFISLPNLLANQSLVPELIQHDARPETIGKNVLERLDETRSQAMQKAFLGLHKELKRDASEQAADAIVELLESNRQ